MSTGFTSSLTFAGKQTIIYLGSITLIAGIVGGFLDIVVFLSLKTFRRSPCGFYLSVMSISNIGQMITGLLSRILTTGFNIDWTLTSLFYCKFRLYCYQVCSLISMTCICLASIDQYFATCSRPRVQQWSNINLARRLSAIFTVIWIIHNAPFLIYYDHIVSLTTGKVTCIITNNVFDQYTTYSITVTLGKVLPIGITLLFGFLAYRNVQQITYRTLPMVRRELDKQLTVMVLVQIVFGFFTITPYTIIYILLKVPQLSQDPTNAACLQYATALTTCMLYIYFAVSVF
ncbi:unnamed protein product [Adineta steineri]|uniref:G-protein coupled receptors family 1 profile domain-containing protein n=1 Tax=Adineta steineri TaxID=433720 RepID=A0A813YCB0_9BILA|nr:unnamed protein product [Adineta steineri]CAF0888052.1 unnamed protein product [Adineta steineri]